MIYLLMFDDFWGFMLFEPYHVDDFPAWFSSLPFFFFRIPDMAKACSPAKLDTDFSWKKLVFQPPGKFCLLHTWDRLGLNINMFKRSQHIESKMWKNKSVSKAL